MGTLGTIQSEKAFYGSSGKGQNAFVDVRDIAAVAATAISEGKQHAGKTYIVIGSELLSNYDMAKTLSNETGTTIKYVDLSPAELGKAYIGSGMNQWTTDALLELDNTTKLGYVAISVEMRRQ